jgi:hypothetical protein
MVGVPAEVMKLVAALEHVEAIDGLAEVRERRSTPTTVRASGFERSGDNSTAYAKARPRVSVQAEGKDEGDPTLARPVRRSAFSRSHPRRCREGCNPHLTSYLSAQM